MNKVIFTGPTQYLGEWHFTRGKIYDMNTGPTPKNPNNLSINRFYIISDNDKNFYMNSVDIHMLMRLCNVYDIPLATNYATATILIKSK